MILIRFLKLPRVVRKSKIIKTRKRYSVNAAEHLFDEAKSTLHNDEAFRVEIIEEDSDTGAHNYIFDLTVNHQSTLLGLLTGDIMKTMREVDEKQRELIIELENKVSLAFAQSSFSNEKEKIDKESDLSSEQVKSVEETPGETEKYIPEYEDVPVEEEKSDEPVNPEPPIAESPEELIVKEKSKQVISVEKKKESLASEQEQLINLTNYLDLTDFVAMKDLDKELESLSLVLSKKESYILDELNLNEPKTFKEQLSKEYIEKHFDSSYLEKVLLKLNQVKKETNQLINPLLSNFYHEKMSDTSLEESQEKTLALLLSVHSQEMKKKLDEEREKQNQLKSNEEDLMKLRHEEALSVLKNKHEQEKMALSNRYSEVMISFEEQLNQRKLIEQEQIRVTESLDFEKKRIKSINNDLLIHRDKQIQAASTTINSTLSNFKETYLTYTNYYRNKLEEQEESFNQLFKDYQNQKNIEKDQEIEEKKIKLKQSELEKKEKQDLEHRKELMELNERFLNMMEEKQSDRLLQLNHQSSDTKQLESLIQELLAKNQIQQVEKVIPPESNRPIVEKIKKNRWKLTSAFFFLVSCGVLATNFVQTNEKQVSAQEKSIQQILKGNEELSTTLAQLIENTTPKEESFEELLSKGKYMDASYLSPKRVSEVVDYLFELGDIPNLSTINSRFPNSYGALYQAILEEKYEKIVVAHESLSVEEKKNLPQMPQRFVNLAVEKVLEERKG